MFLFLSILSGLVSMTNIRLGLGLTSVILGRLRDRDKDTYRYNKGIIIHNQTTQMDN